MQAQPNPAQPSTAFRYVSPFQADYLKFNGREPRKLEQLAIAHADLEHRNRVNEVKRMAKKLALLDPLLPAIAAAGGDLHTRHLWCSGDSVIRVRTSWSTKPDDQLLSILLSQGFKEVERKDYLSKTDLVTLKHGRALLLQLEISKPATDVPGSQP